MATTNSIGTSSRDYSTIAAWLAAIPSTPTGGYIGQCYNDTEFAEAINITGFTTSAANFITLTTGSGQSFIDNAGATSNPQFYDQSKGVANAFTCGILQNLVSCDDSYTTIEKIQFKQTGGNGSTAYLNAFSLTGVVLQNCIIAKTYSDPNHGGIFFNRSGLVVNCLAYYTNPDSTSKGADGFQGLFINCAFINTGSAGSTTAVNNNFGSGMTITDCAFFGFSAAQIGTDSLSYCATDLASGFTGSNITYSLTFSNEYVSTSDLRLKSGNHMAVGQRQQTYTNDLDIVGQSRSTTTPCIGQWEFQAGGGDTLMGAILT